MTTRRPDTSTGRLVSLRTAVILLISVAVGMLIGALTLLGGSNVPLSVVAGLGAAGVALPGLNGLIDR